MEHPRVPQTVRCEGYLAACYRDISDTKPFHFSKPNPKSDQRPMENRKSRESMWPSINYKEKTSTYLVPRVLFNLELIDMAQRLHILENFLQKQRCRGNATCFVCHSKFKPSEINDSYNVKRCYRLQLRYRSPLYANFVSI